MFFQSTKVEELEDHCVLVQEPGHTYFGIVTCDSGSEAGGTLASILAYMKEKDEDLSKHKADGCDGTAVNTGSKRGVIHRLVW